MRVAVIEPTGKVITTGEWDGRRVDGEFAKINGELYHLGYCYLEEFAELIANSFQHHQAAVKKVEDEKFTNIYAMRNKYGAR